MESTEWDRARARYEGAYGEPFDAADPQAWAGIMPIYGEEVRAAALATTDHSDQINARTRRLLEAK